MSGCSLAKRKIRDPLFCKATLTHPFPVGLGSEHLGFLSVLCEHISLSAFTPALFTVILSLYLPPHCIINT